MSQVRKKFQISAGSVQEELVPFEAKRALVVCFFGRSGYGDVNSSSNIVDLILSRNVFSNSFEEDISETAKGQIEGYYDENLNTVFLNIRNPVDFSYMTRSMEEFHEDVQSKGFPIKLSEIKDTYARAVLFASLLSHILVMVEPTANFDISTIMFLKTLDNIRSRAKDCVSEAIRSVYGLPRTWAANGRPCSPRLLFLYLRLPPSIEQLKQVSSTKFETSVRKLETSLADKIYRLFRKSRVITNVSANSLLALPSSKPFVHVYRGTLNLKSRTEFMLNLLSHYCGDKVLVSENRFVSCSAETALRFFLEDHIEKGLTDGFDDNVSRHGVTNIFELPSGEVWWKVVCRLYKCIMENVEVKEGTSSGKLGQILPSLKTMMGTDVKFSEIKCSKVLPLAIAAYQEGLPSHYTKEHHETRLAHAVALFSMHARGSMVEKYLAKLEEECVTIWGKGRQMCETLSLTGNPCINSIHRLPQEEKADEEKSLPVMDHSSGVRMVAACNCGRQQGPREDPFDLKAANLYTYDLMEIDCCSHLEHVDLGNEQDEHQDEKKKLADMVPYVGQPADLVSSFSSWSLKCVGPSSYYSHNIGLSDMMPGFLAHTGFLLPWDVAVKIEHAEKWPTILESSRRHRSGRTDKYSKNLKSEAEFTVKIFIGEEYECPRGHRFICCAPEKILRAPTTGVKETAVRIIGSDMPLYMTCPCRSNKSLIAQLMRIHIVTPKAPVTVSLDPHIRFGPDMQGITFVTGKKEVIKLSQSAYWILRLPYIYQTLDGPILPPKDLSTSAVQGYFLKGAFSVVETSVKETVASK